MSPNVAPGVKSCATEFADIQSDEDFVAWLGYSSVKLSSIAFLSDVRCPKLLGISSLSSRQGFRSG